MSLCEYGYGKIGWVWDSRIRLMAMGLEFDGSGVKKKGSLDLHGSSDYFKEIQILATSESEFTY